MVQKWSRLWPVLYQQGVENQSRANSLYATLGLKVLSPENKFYLFGVYTAFLFSFPSLHPSCFMGDILKHLPWWGDGIDVCDTSEACDITTQSTSSKWGRTRMVCQSGKLNFIVDYTESWVLQSLSFAFVFFLLKVIVCCASQSTSKHH